VRRRTTIGTGQYNRDAWARLSAPGLRQAQAIAKNTGPAACAPQAVWRAAPQLQRTRERGVGDPRTTEPEWGGPHVRSMIEAFGHYRILDEIGVGGLGEMYRARDTRLGRTVAITVISPGIVDNPDRRERFLRDAHASSALSHPNIAALYETGEDQDRLFLACEFVPGDSLKHVVGGRPLHPRRAVDFAAQIADALAEAHAHGIVHCDIRGENIVITPKDKAKVLDFGLAAWTGSGADGGRADGATTLSGTAARVTPRTGAYRSPEQVRGEPVDHRTDVFSLGSVLFEMLTGQLPFTGATAVALATAIVETRPAAPSTINRTVPPELDAVVAKALAKSLDGRYGSAAIMAAELRSVAAILDVRARRSESSGRAPVAATRVRRRPRLRWIVLAIVAAALALLWFSGSRFSGSG
jgi:serine/threonine protein kinase